MAYCYLKFEVMYSKGQPHNVLMLGIGLKERLV
jgi:hypothetical protein